VESPVEEANFGPFSSIDVDETGNIYVAETCMIHVLSTKGKTRRRGTISDEKK
jgi:hypothetical protein